MRTERGVKFGLAGLVVAAALSACGRGGPAYAPPAPGTAAVVTMSNTFGFAPERLVVSRGGTIEWRNTSLVTHTVTADPARLPDPALVQVPAGATPFNSGEVRPGQVFRTTLTVPGTYRYVCLPHHDVFGMTGVVEVTP